MTLVHCVDAGRNSSCHTFPPTAGNSFYIKISSLKAGNKLTATQSDNENVKITVFCYNLIQISVNYNRGWF